MFGEQHEVLLLAAFVILTAVWIVAQLVLLWLGISKWVGHFVTDAYFASGMVILVVLVWPSDWANRGQLLQFASLLVVFAFYGVVVTFACLHSYRRHHRLKTGLCLACGYDLRASKDQCPECGTPIAIKGGAIV